MYWNYGGTSTSISIDENSTGSTGNTYTAVDPEGASITYGINSSTYSSYFTINSSGLLTVSSAFDYETVTSTQITITAAAGGHTITQNIAVTINDVAENTGPNYTQAGLVPSASSVAYKDWGDTNVSAAKNGSVGSAKLMNGSTLNAYRVNGTSFTLITIFKVGTRVSNKQRAQFIYSQVPSNSQNNGT